MTSPNDIIELRSGWYAVRCIFRSTWPPDGSEVPLHRYEERITLWRTGSIDEAIALAEADADDYAKIIKECPSTYLGLAQGYALSDDPGHGAEVFSLIRSSQLDGEDYLDRFFDTGHEHQQSG